jgi:hypothetical protein
MTLLLMTAVAAQQPAQPAQAAPGAPPAPAAAPIVSRISPPPDGHRFSNGVTYFYKAEWKLWNAGIATLRLDRDPNGMERITATAVSTGFVGKLFHVDDRFEAIFDPRSFCSAYITKRTEEGRRKRTVQIRFDYQRQKSVLEDTNLRSGQKKVLESNIPMCVTDVLSALFYAGSLRLQPGEAHIFPLNDGATIDLKANIEQREQITTDAGTFNTIRVQPDAAIGKLKTKGKVWIWYSEDAERIPVQLRARMFWGTLTLRLDRVERAQKTTAGEIAPASAAVSAACR